MLLEVVADEAERDAAENENLLFTPIDKAPHLSAESDTRVLVAGLSLQGFRPGECGAGSKPNVKSRQVLLPQLHCWRFFTRRRKSTGF